MSNVQDLVLKQVEQRIADSEKGYQTNKKLADQWGLCHIILGLSTAIFSSASALFTFLNQPSVVIPTSLISAFAASSLTFLSPSSRETKRRYAAQKLYIVKQNGENLKIKLSSSSISEDEILKNGLKELQKISEDLAIVLQDLSEQIK